MSKKNADQAFAEFVEVIRRLRAPDGCPWDRAQTPATLRQYVIEEAYEVVEAIERNDPAAVCEELGDLLLQIVLQAQIFSETNTFTITEVISAITAKMRERHPHVFGDAKAETPEEVRQNWVRIKQETKGEHSSALGNVPRSLPALLRAQRLTENAAEVGFDWSRTEEVVAKVKEEWQELEAEIKQAAAAERSSPASVAPNKLEHEFGDLLFALVNLGRFLKINPEEALARAIDRFSTRFQFIEASARAAGKSLEQMDLEEMETFWQEAKRKGL